MGNSYTFFERYAALCKARGESPNSVAREIGASSGSVTAWKNGTEPRYSTIAKIADYFCVSTDYLLGRTDDPIDYDNDGDLIASIPSSYLEACDGDVRRAYAMMSAVDEDNCKKNAPILTEKDESDIANDLKRITNNLESEEVLMFDGDPLDDESRAGILAAIEVALRIAKKKNKQKYNPKKHW